MRPDSVDIFGKRYTITYHDRPSDVDHEGRRAVWGQTDLWKHSIRIYGPPEFENGEVWDSILHEVLHALIAELKLNVDDEETVVSLLGMGLADVLHRNGWLREDFS